MSAAVSFCANGLGKDEVFRSLLDVLGPRGNVHEVAYAIATYVVYVPRTDVPRVLAIYPTAMIDYSPQTFGEVWIAQNPLRKRASSAST